MDDKQAKIDRVELEWAGVRARTSLDQIEANVAAQSPAGLDTSFREVRDALLNAGGPVEQITRDLLAHEIIAPGRRALITGDNSLLWEMLAMLEVMLARLRCELTDAHLEALGIRP